MTEEDIRTIARAIAEANHNPESDEPDARLVFEEKVVAAFKANTTAAAPAAPAIQPEA